MVMEPKIHPLPPLSTPEQAPWDAIRTLIGRLDTLISIYEAWGMITPAGVPTVAPTVVGVPGAPPAPGAPAVISVSTPWEATEPEEIFRESIRGTGVFLSKMYNAKKAKRVLIWAESSLDQAVMIQATGNIKDNQGGAVEIGPSLDCSAYGNREIGLDWEDWIPYVGCEITVNTAPTTGVLKIHIVAQE